MSTPSPVPAADRNLLFGILALQMDFIGKDALIGALHAWVLDKAKPLGQILAEQGKLTPDVRSLLEAMVAKHIQVHAGDPQQSLAALSSASSVRQELQQLADADVQASLAHVPVGTGSRAEGTVSFHGTGPAAPGLRYRVLRPHARGGLGEVFVAEDTELHREVALKEIRAEHAGDTHSRGRFLLEAEVTGGLEHPGIVPVYGLGQYDDGRPFYAMRFIKGDNLKEAIARFHQAETPQRDAGERNVAFRELLGRFVDVCQAIAYAHSRGVLHRDLKPGNIMLGKYGETLVVDWGLAKPLVGRERRLAGVAPEEPTLRPSSADSSLAATRMGNAVGTPAFMSPEQAAGRLDQLGPASDVYSLGATLYALLTGRAPFAGDVGEVLRQVQRGEFAPPRKVKPDVPAALEAICLKAMAVQPEQRYRTALQLAEDIEHWLADEPVSAWPEPVTVKLRRWARRHRTVVSALAASLLVGLIALSVGAFWYQQHQADQRRRHDLREQGIAEALAQARQLRGKLHEQLARSGGVFALLNQPAEWQQQIELAEAAWQRANDLKDSAEAPVAPELDQDLAELATLLAQDQADRRLAQRLEQIREDRSAWVKGQFNFALAGREYPKTFQAAGVSLRPARAPQEADLIRQSAIREQLLAALDDWAYVAWRQKAHDLHKRLLQVTQRADSSPWKDQVRNPANWTRAKVLKGLATQAREDKALLEQLSPKMLHLLGLLLEAKGGDAEGWLRQAQALHPSDFWLNFGLAFALEKSKPQQAEGFYRAALAIRPRSTAAWNNLGLALHDQKDLKGAADAYRRALTLAPTDANAWYNLGTALQDQKDLPGAVAAFQQALKLAPKDTNTWYNLGVVLQEHKDWPGAADAYRRLLQLTPDDAEAHCNLGHVLREQGEFVRALEEFRRGHQLGSAQPGWNLPSAQWIKACEAQLQLERRCLDVLAGKAQPKGPTEQLELAQFCQRYDKPRAAVHLYTGAFAAQASLAVDLAKGYRFLPAAAAARAAAGQGRETGPLDAKEQAKLRRQALDWLRADLKLYTKIVAEFQAAAKEENPKPSPPQPAGPGAADRFTTILRIYDRLGQWQTDSDLGSIRDARKPTQLPPEGQKDFRQLWTEADKVRAQVRACFTEKVLAGNLTVQQKEQVHEVKLQAARTYAFDLESQMFDAFLRLEDHKGRKLAENDDIEDGVIQNSRIVFTAPQDGAYRLVASALEGQGTGAYVLRIREVAGRK